MKAALVTGSSSGIGEGIARRLHADGYAVMLNGFKTQAAGEALAAELGERAAYFDADVSDSAAARALVQAAVDAFGRLDVLVNNAGIAKPIPHEDLDAVDDDFWDAVMGVNLRGPWLMSKAARGELAKNQGQIINTASIAGLGTTGSSIPYCVSKAGVIHLTKLLAKALGPDIRVNAVAPAYIDTPLTHDWTALRERVIAQAPARRLGAPQDVAEVVSSLLSMSYVTGQVIAVDGGLNLL